VTVSSHKPLCVLATGRSGSSLLTRVLDLLGVDLGPTDEMLAANDYNPRGFWENTRISDLNDEILAQRGGRWLAPPPPQPGWEDDPAFDALRGRVAELIAETFTSGGRWAFKDPRAVLTLPLWRQVTGEMDYIICARPASEVVVSLLRNMPGEDGWPYVQWWLDLNALALTQTVGCRRHVVLYESWFSDPRRVARDLAAFVHGDPDAVPEETYAEVMRFFEPKLRRVRDDDEPVYGAAPEVRAMYTLLELVASQEPGASPESQAHIAVLAQALADGHRRRAAAQTAQWAAEARAADAADELVAAKASGDQAEEERQRVAADLEGRVAELSAREDDLSGQVARLHASVVWAQEYIADLERWRDDLVVERDALLTDAGRAAADRDAARRELAAATARLRGLERSASWRATKPLRALRHRPGRR
jgi:hypothetical protein